MDYTKKEISYNSARKRFSQRNDEHFMVCVMLQKAQGEKLKFYFCVTKLLRRMVVLHYRKQSRTTLLNTNSEEKIHNF